MHILTHSRKFHRFTTNAYTAQAKVFRFYDCLDRGYVIMTNGKVIGTADNIVQAEKFAVEYDKAQTNMVNCSFSAEWYNEIKDRVPHGVPLYYIDTFYNCLCVEVDVNEAIFNAVSTELGWM